MNSPSPPHFFPAKFERKAMLKPWLSCRCYGDYIEVCDCFISNAVLILNSIFDCPITDCTITNCPIGW